jgi:hypothetical protein
MPEKDKTLLEWYEEIQDAPHPSNVDKTIGDFVKGPEMDVPKQAVEVEIKKPEEKPEERKETIDRWSDLYKCFALLKILENKFTILSGELNTPEEEKNKVKADIKLIVDKIKKVVDAI